MQLQSTAAHDSITRETTINMKEEILMKLTTLSLLYGVSRSEIIKRCLRRFTKEKFRDFKFFRLTAFQPSSNDYKTFHISISPLEYELFFDLKKVLKLSFSHIVRLALLAFMDEYNKEAQPTTSKSNFELDDEYRLKSYKIAISTVKKITHFSFSWEKG